MKAKTIVRILTVVLLAIMLVSTGLTVVNAANVTIPIDQVKGDTTSDIAKGVNNIGGTILGVLQVAAAVIAVIVLVVLAIKYIMASPNDKADIKKSATGYIIGAVILFGASGLLAWLQNTVSKVIE